MVIHRRKTNFLSISISFFLLPNTMNSRKFPLKFLTDVTNIVNIWGRLANAIKREGARTDIYRPLYARRRMNVLKWFWFERKKFKLTNQALNYDFSKTIIDDALDFNCFSLPPISSFSLRIFWALYFSYIYWSIISSPRTFPFYSIYQPSPNVHDISHNLFKLKWIEI